MKTDTRDQDVIDYEERQRDAAQAERERRERRDAERRADALDVAFTSQERSTARHALIVAAEKFEEDAKYVRGQKDAGAGFVHLAAHLERQAKESRELAERLEA